jgi:hypothetical protein
MFKGFLGRNDHVAGRREQARQVWENYQTAKAGRLGGRVLVCQHEDSARVLGELEAKLVVRRSQHLPGTWSRTLDELCYVKLEFCMDTHTHERERERERRAN